MGSMITLGINKMEIDWGKNSIFREHSALFQSTDVKQIPYYYFDWDTESPIVEMKEGYSKKLSNVKERLDLLGYTLKSISVQYNEIAEDASEHGLSVIDFEQFYNAIFSIDLSKVDMRLDNAGYVNLENGYDLGEYACKCILHDPEINSKLPVDIWSAPEFLENIDPYIIVRILAENPANKSFELQWRTADDIDNGWVKREELIKPLSASQKIMIVTEGSSDSFIIKKTIDSLYPNISDFFDFIDMEKNYPFTGVGNLYNFFQGLAKIQILNKVLVVFDNDTAGIEKYRLAQELDRPKNLHICRLPNHKEFDVFDTVGPDGNSKADINGKAVSIECFLDLGGIAPFIRWTSYNKNLEQYQGAINPKEDLVRAFKSCNLSDGNYNATKLKSLIDYLIKQMVDTFYG